jgi:hypothetical protein
VNPALESFTPKGFEALIPTMPKNVMEMFMGKTLNPEGLDARTQAPPYSGGAHDPGAPRPSRRCG